jgi:hypothetical protein
LLTRTLLNLTLLSALSACFAPVASADFYKYTDSSGAVNITNTLEAVPQKYRSRVKVVRDETLKKQDPGAQKQQAPQPAAEESAVPQAVPEPAPVPQGRFAELSERYTWFKPLVYVAGIIAAFLAVIKVASMVPSPQLSKLIYLSFFIGVFVFLYQAYIQHVVADSLAVKNKAVDMMKKANQREIALPGEAPPAPAVR